jgi:hypothetical protein
VTAVVPTGKKLPGAFVLVMFTTQLSVIVGAVQVTFVPHVPAFASAFTVIVEGQPEITGLFTSFTTTLNVQVAVLPDASVAVYVTAVVPTGKKSPDAFVLVIFTTQLSVTVGGVHVTFVPHVPAPVPALTVIVVGQLSMIGL